MRPGIDSPPGRRFLGIDSWAPETFTNTGPAPAKEDRSRFTKLIYIILGKHFEKFYINNAVNFINDNGMMNGIAVFNIATAGHTLALLQTWTN
jgi:hypothetical protein